MSGRTVWRGAICAVSAAIVAGCAAGSGGAAGRPQTVMVSAATKSEAASTFHISAEETMTPLSGTPYIPANRASLSGDVDLSAGSAHLKATLVGALTGGGKAPQELSFEVIQIGNDSWESTTGLGGLLQLGDPLPPGHWIKDDASSSVSSFPDPARLFDALKSKASQVRVMGTAKVDGVACDRYQVTGPSSLFDALGGGSSDQTLDPGPVSMQVWVDRSNLVRRLSTTMKENMGPPGQVESIAVTVDFTDYGEAVQIVPPPASLVVPNP